MTDVEELIDRLNRNMPPATRLLEGKVVAANIEERWAEMTFQMKPEYCHSMGLQGGYIAAMLDNAMARAVFLVSNETLSPPTLELKVSYLAPGPRANTARAVASSTWASRSPSWRRRYGTRRRR